MVYDNLTFEFWKMLPLFGKFLFNNKIPEGYLFSREDIIKLIVPLVFEQLLAIFVGLADSIMVSSAGESAVSGVSLVDCVFILIIQTFAALATGGAVVSGQYLGMHDNKDGCRAVNQLFIFVAILGFAVAASVYLGKNLLLDHVFGKIAPDVRSAANTYLLITAASIPFIAFFNSGAAIFRAQGNSKLPMQISIAMNIINVCGNATLVYGFHMGTAGVAIPTLVSRAVAGCAAIYFLCDTSWKLHFTRPFHFILQARMLKKILYIGIPNGMESFMFQLGKIILLSLISTFGTASITANAISNAVCSFHFLPGAAVGFAMLAVVSQCVGAHDFKQVRFYNAMLMRIAYIFVIISTLFSFAVLPLVMRIYSVSAEADRMAVIIILMHGVATMILWPAAFAFPNTLRASNDVTYTMVVAIISMWIMRIGGGYFCAVNLKMGVIGVWLAMNFDWIVRIIFFTVRYHGTKWQKTRL